MVSRNKVLAKMQDSPTFLVHYNFVCSHMTEDFVEHVKGATLYGMDLGLWSELYSKTYNYAVSFYEKVHGLLITLESSEDKKELKRADKIMNKLLANYIDISVGVTLEDHMIASKPSTETSTVTIPELPDDKIFIGFTPAESTREETSLAPGAPIYWRDAKDARTYLCVGVLLTQLDTYFFILKDTLQDSPDDVDASKERMPIGAIHYRRGDFVYVERPKEIPLNKQAEMFTFADFTILDVILRHTLATKCQPKQWSRVLKQMFRQHKLVYVPDEYRLLNMSINDLALPVEEDFLRGVYT